MGGGSGVFCVIYISAHLAFILAAISMSTHYWIRADPNQSRHNNTGGPHNSTVLTYSKGLWKYCTVNITTVYVPLTANHTGSQEYNQTGYEEESCVWAGITHEVNATWGNRTMEVEETDELFRVTQYMFSMGFALVAMGTVLFYVFMCIKMSRSSLCVASFMTLCFFLSGCTMVVALVITGENYHSDKDLRDLPTLHYDIHLGWSMYTGLAGNVLTFIACVASGYNLNKIQQSSLPYENLGVYA